MLHGAPRISTCKRRRRCIFQGPGGISLSNGSFGPAATEGYVKYYVRALLESSMNAILEVTDDIQVARRIPPERHPRPFPS